MGKDTKIEWADDTWNSWVGCSKVSQGCQNCYMFRDLKHYGHDPTEIHRTAAATFNKPLSWARKPENRGRFVFTCSYSDFFISDADDWRADAWDIIRRTPELCYQILTKRPENILDRLPPDWNGGWDNVWLGVSAENQKRADERLPELLSVPAQLHFVSYEPALGEINLTHWLDRIGWVICGGESDWKPRPMKIEWAQSIRDQCTAFNVPFFLKQLGGNPNNKRDGILSVLDGQRHTARPDFQASQGIAQLTLF